jgi:hypothetical protein
MLLRSWKMEIRRIARAQTVSNSDGLRRPLAPTTYVREQLTSLFARPEVSAANLSAIQSTVDNGGLQIEWHRVRCLARQRKKRM